MKNKAARKLRQVPVTFTALGYQYSLSRTLYWRNSYFSVIRNHNNSGPAQGVNRETPGRTLET